MKVLRLFATLAPLALVAACSSASEPTGSTEESLAMSGDDVGDPAPRPIDPLPIFEPAVCKTINPSCSSSPWPYLDATKEAERIALGCGPAFHWFSGGNAGLLGGILSRCPDTKAVRDYFGIGFNASYCDKCIRPAGRGHLYAFWEEFVGPDCPSTCIFVPPPDSI